METKDVIKWWGFPNSTIINRNLPKTQIYPHMKEATDKHFLQDSVQNIYVLATLRKDNTNIDVYEDDKELYQEIQFLYVKTKGKGDSTKIYKMLSLLIPYPLVILTDEPDSFTIYTGRFEKKSTGYLNLANIYPSPVYQDEELQMVLHRISFINLPNQNMKVLYDGIRDEIATFMAKVQYGETVGHIDSEKKDKLDDLKKQMEDLRSNIKKEPQLNRKIDMQMKLKKLKDEFSSEINH
ncbi:chemotaxis protein [Lentilactobacillus curieae]|uniref:Chemotaxis protein n=1 Tax=Lentilactobacillus curieae TaxID=1138822 RepID=A0A1S6QH62_9LACO|nr:chemotaxis protein [Lentilactobacillus curieae]